MAWVGTHRGFVMPAPELGLGVERLGLQSSTSSSVPLGASETID